MPPIWAASASSVARPFTAFASRTSSAFSASACSTISASLSVLPLGVLFRSMSNSPVMGRLTGKRTGKTAVPISRDNWSAHGRPWAISQKTWKSIFPETITNQIGYKAAVISRIRDVRRARRMTLQQVAEACVPPTTAQTIGRLETGMRTVSVGWLNRIAAALGVEAAELVRLPERVDVPVAAVLGPEGAAAPRTERLVVPPQPSQDHVAVLVEIGIGDYRAGDEIWL